MNDESKVAVKLRAEVTYVDGVKINAWGVELKDGDQKAKNSYTDFSK